MAITQKAADKLVRMFNEIFDEMSLSSEGVIKTHWYILKEGAIRIEFDDPAKKGLTELYYKKCPSFWARLKEMF